jgi:multidrug efflux pump subunit AcrA (membrane-fusion protein)
MFTFATSLPTRSPELEFRLLADGQCVVKNRRTGDYYHLGAEEHFLLTQLDGERDAATICTAFARSFGQPLAEEELDEFLQRAEEQGLLRPGPGLEDTDSLGHRSDTSTRQGILYWRKSILDPDRLFTMLAPKIWFFWTRAFLVLSAGSILVAAMLLWVNRHELASSLRHATRWETAVLGWLIFLFVAALHEFAHGLTCKHHGGEVREIGVLFMFLMPCFYCNVSDAWFFREKSKRLWVTFAGGYFELFLWALAVFVWRLTVPQTVINYLAFVVLALTGVQTLLNFNPLIKLDGYYLLSDWLEIPNLSQRARARWTGHLRWLLWGAPRPPSEPKGRLLLTFGAASSVFSVSLLVSVLAGLLQFFGSRWGWAGLGLVAVGGLVSAPALFQGFSTGELRNMIGKRRKRTLLWCMILAGLGAFPWLIQIEDRVSGPFQVRSETRAEVHAPVAGFLQELYVREGDRASPGMVIARLEVPDLDSRLTQKRAQVRQIEARLHLLEVGARPQEVAEQRRRVQRMESWRNSAQKDLGQTRQALEAELSRLDSQIAECRAEEEGARDACNRAIRILSRGAISQAECRMAQTKCEVSRARLDQAQAEKRTRQAKGALEAEAELARRDQQLADARALLTLLEVGSRPEEINAERARLAQLREEAKYLDHLRGKLLIRSPVYGLVTTARLKEKTGQYLREGDLICVVEDPCRLEAEIILAEQDADRARSGQPVVLRARGLPFKTLESQVARLAPVASTAEVHSILTVYCTIDNSSLELRPGMTGYARVYTGPRSIGDIAVDRALRFLRTEFWPWWQC